VSLLFRACVLSIATVFVCFASSAAVEEPKTIGAFEQWAAYTLGPKGAQICYVYGEPQKATGDYAKRGAAYVQVANRQKDKVAGELSVTAGYAYKKDSDAELEVDGNKFLLFTKDEGAWARDAKIEAAAVKAMRAGKAMVVRGTSARGTKTTDIYSLTGFGAALNAINTACGVK
jgi:hypothetical protein